MSTRRSSRRTKKQIDYSKIGDIDGISDDELAGKQKRHEVESESDEFELDDKNDENAEEDDDEEIDLAAEDEEDDDHNGEAEEDLDDVDIIRTTTKAKTKKSKPRSEDEDTYLENGTYVNGNRNALKSNKMPKPVALRPSKAPGVRAESLKERFQLFYGNNDSAFVYGINQRIKWGMRPFIPEPELFEVPKRVTRLHQKYINAGVGNVETSTDSDSEPEDDVYLFTEEEVSEKQVLIHINSQEMASYVPGSLKTMKIFTDKACDVPVQLPCFEPTFIHKSHPQAGIIANAGSFICASSWAPGFDGEYQYLAVATLPENSSGEATSIYPQISAFATQPSPTSIQVYRLNTNIPDGSTSPEDYFQLVAVFATESGPITKLAWRPLGPSPSAPDTELAQTKTNKTSKTKGKGVANNITHIGVLAAGFQDGKARLLDVKVNAPPSGPSGSKSREPLYVKVDKFLREYSLDSKITCIAWRTLNTIVLGTADGFIAEFDVSDTSIDGIYPSFYIPVHDSFINLIVTCFPFYENLVFTSSADGFTRLVDVRDIQRSRTISTRFKGYTTCASYCAQLSSFVSLEDTFTTKITPIRRLNILQGATNITRHEASVSSVSGSYLHPMIISGGADGTLHIGNAIRRSTVSKRQTNAIYKETILWEFDAPEKFPDTCKFVDILQAKDLPKAPAIERQFIYPRTAVVSSVEWNQNQIAGSWYVAGLSSGVLRIENLACPQ
ncbi:transcription factor TFIIIC subunit TFC6 [Sugiyamaella lignohabitans]|uniref:Transcription factor TFIIIC subunit TFC6 n=1 Tax=Sugiyamaella lignohabitans TaxID=796027 RepID=A0A167D071_9ASCO|nr:transcription factor TFIIIC subunit TFC6 [Sugiyamaella lignohabitans]ANB12316.1 transcription factor TFIIIC subunit TFC6 [Sugiyamaella lignohabitans]